MYPRNAASPEPIAIGAVVQISDGAVQTSGCTVRIKPIGVAEGDGAGTTAYSTDGIVYYTPTQGETNYTSFILIAKKASCLPACVTVVTTASSVPGRTMPADGSITAAVIADNAIDTATFAAGTTIPRVTLADTVTTYTGNTPQTGDSFARIGVNGAGLTSLATAAQIAAMTVNTRVNYQVPIEIELPDSSTQIFKIRLHLFDEEGNMEAPDSTPTIALTNAAGTDRSSRLSVASNPSTGVYSWDYTATAGDAEEQLVWVFTVVEGTLTRTYPATSYVVEESAYRFSSTDRATLNAAATQASVNDVPTVAEFEARTLAAASYATAAAIAAEAVKTANIQTRLPAALESGRIAAVLDSAVGTQIDNIENASGWLLAIQSGACANPQTSAEQYDITAFGVAFRVVMAGQTSTGTRTAPTLSKP